MKLPKYKLPQKPVYLKFEVSGDFFSVFAQIAANFENAFLLESLGEEGDRSRHSVIGFDPEMIISARGATLTIANKDKIEAFKFPQSGIENPYQALREIFPQNVISRGYAGGLVGFISYEGVNYFEPGLKLKTHSDFEEFKFGVFQDGLVYDKTTGEVFYFYYKVDRSQLLLDTLKKQNVQTAKPKVQLIGDSMSESQHATTVKKVKEDIIAGKVFQAEVGFKTKYKISGDTLHIYEKLRQVNPSPHMYYLKFGTQQIIGASPELLLRVRDREVETYPLAGTAKRGETGAEDQMLARELLSDPKEIAEHSMLVDLHRNDIGRVAHFGSVKVRNLMSIKKYSHVQHISTEVFGLLAKEHDMYSALANNFPAGTLTGAPKIEAMKIISDLEPEARGVYGGALGHFGFNGDCTFAIPIRTLFVNGENAYAQTCGGNVYDSNPKSEYDEIKRKLSAMQKTLENFY